MYNFRSDISVNLLWVFAYIFLILSNILVPYHIWEESSILKKYPDDGYDTSEMVSSGT